MLQVKCIICSKLFSVKPYRFKVAKFCSRECYGISIKGVHPKSEFKKGQRPSPETEFKAGNKHLYFGKSSPAKGKHWRLSDATKEKMSISQKGVKHLGSTDELHWDWKGDDAKYRAKHYWIVRKCGLPDTCENCGISGLSGREIHWSNKDHKYKRDINDWQRLCRKCHREYDKKYLRR